MDLIRIILAIHGFILLALVIYLWYNYEKRIEIKEKIIQNQEEMLQIQDKIRQNRERIIWRQHKLINTLKNKINKNIKKL